MHFFYQNHFRSNWTEYNIRFYQVDRSRDTKHIHIYIYIYESSLESVQEKESKKLAIEKVGKKRSKRKKNNRSRLVRYVTGRRTDLRKKYFGTGVVCLAWFRNREFAITVHEVASGQSRWAEGRSRIISCGSRHRWLNREKSFIKATADENRIAEWERDVCTREREREAINARTHARTRVHRSSIRNDGWWRFIAAGTSGARFIGRGGQVTERATNKRWKSLDPCIMRACS